MFKKIIVTGCVFGALSVAFGAFAAHILEPKLTTKMFKAFETAARYQMYHSIAIILTGILNKLFELPHLITAFKFFTVGIILFSGSLYSLSLLSLQSSTTFNFIGILTPLGGLCFISAWIILAFGLIKMK